MNSTTPSIERRQQARASVDSLVYLSLGEENGGILLDIDDTGFCMQTALPLDLGSPCQRHARFTGNGDFEADCELVWEQSGQAGFKFSDLSAGLRLRLQEWIAASGILPLCSGASVPTPVRPQIAASALAQLDGLGPMLLNSKETKTTKKHFTQQKERGEAYPARIASLAARTRARRRLVGVLIVAVAPAMVGVLRYSRKAPAPFTKLRQVAIGAHQPASRSGSAIEVQPEHYQQFAPANHEQPMAVVAVKPSSAATSPRHESSYRRPVIRSQSPVATTVPEKRLLISGAPDSGFSYPVAPDPTLTGKVSLKATIGTDGSVRKVDILSGRHALAAAAVRAVKRWRYRSHERDGQAVEAEANIMFSFLGDGAVAVSFPEAH